MTCINSETHDIIIAVESTEAAEFVRWLNEQGHNASIGTDTGNWIDGQNADNDPALSDKVNALWESYCNR